MEYFGAVTADSAAPIPLPSCDKIHSYCKMTGRPTIKHTSNNTTRKTHKKYTQLVKFYLKN